MRKVGIWLGVLLCAGVLLVVLKRDDSVPTQSSVPSVSALPPAALTNSKTLNWTNAAARFGEASAIETRQTFDAVTQKRRLVEVVKTRSKYPHLRVETDFAYDAQAEAWRPRRPIEYVADQVLVELKPGVTEQQFAGALEKLQGCAVQKHQAGPSLMVLIGLPKPTVDAVPEAMKQLAKFSELFEVVEPHFLRRVSATPNDPRFSEQWALQNIRAPAAWDLQRGKASVVVAVLDSGIDHHHPELAARVWANPGEKKGNLVDDDRNGFVDDYRGINFAYDNSNPYDDLDHGTLVSGIIAAAANNAQGTAGICWDVRIMPVKIIDADGFLFSMDEVRGYDYARTEGAKIINASFGGDFYSQSEYNAISRLRTAGVLLIAAAGNDARNTDAEPNYPSSFPLDNVVAVAYSDANDLLSPHSNFGAVTVDLAAPGVNVLSTALGGGYRSGSGSSFAVPHVAGVAALVRAQFPAITYAQLKTRLLNNTDLHSGLTGRCVSGGRLNAFEPLIATLPVVDAVDAPSLAWQTGGARPWFGFRLVTADGVDAARSGNITDNQWSWLRTTVTGPGRISFSWKVSCEANFDYLEFAVDGQQSSFIHGETGWETVTHNIPAGTHTLQWAYKKDVSRSAGEDQGHLDLVSFTRDTTGPALAITAPTDTNVHGHTLSLQGTASDPSGVAAVEYSVGAGPWQAVSTSEGFVTWQAQITLAPGTNLVRLRAVDAFNQTTSLNRTYLALSPITVNVAGCGTLNPNLAGTTWQRAGQALSIQAIPCAGQLFTHWSGDLSSTNALLTFVAQPNLALQAHFVPNPFLSLGGFFNGLFHEASGVLHESSGLFKMILSTTGAFTGWIVLGGITNNFTNRFDPVTGHSAFSLPRVEKSAVQFALQLDIGGGSEQITGQISDGVWVADVLADRYVYNATNLPPYAGTYTLVFPGGPDFTAAPSGHGFATATVNSSGRVSVYGRMPDNWGVLQIIPTSRNGDWPFYQPLYVNNSGSALGWLKFLSGPNGFTNQLTSWVRPSITNAGYYRSGFSNEFTVIGSPYQVPNGTRVIACTNALLTLSGADFANPLTNRFVLTESNTVLNQGPHNVSLTIVPTNGTFTGTVIFSPTHSNNFQGVFLQNQNLGLGYFKGSNYMGDVRFEPVE